MRKDILEYIDASKNMKEFIRENPIWYRKLTRNPYQQDTLQMAAMNYFQQTIPHKVAKLNDSIQLANMLFYMYQGMKAGD